MLHVRVGLLISLLVCLTALPSWAASDDFNRADSTDLGTAWDAGYTGDVNLQIVGNRVRSTSTTADSTETYNAVTLANDQQAELTIATLTGAGNVFPRLLLRFAAPATKSGYEFTVVRDGTAVKSRIARWDAGVFTSLVTESGTAWAAGDVLRAEAQGTTLRLSRNGSLLLTATDSTFAGGRAGILVYAATIGEVEVDNFSANDLNACRSGLSLLGAGGC